MRTAEDTLLVGGLLAVVSYGFILSSCVGIFIAKLCTGSFILPNYSFMEQRRLPGVSNGSTLFIFSNELDLKDDSSCVSGEINDSK